MSTFRYHPDIINRYPDLCAGVIIARGMINNPSPELLREAFLTEQRATLERIGDTPLSEIPTLAAWRAALRAFGVNPTKYRSAPEALLRRLTKKGDIPSINTLVDISNLVSIRYSLPVATFDTHAIQGAVTVRFADGNERFTPLGVSEVENPEPSEVIFADDTALVIARRWCWRQSDESAAGADTREAIITTEAQHPGGMADIQAALHDLLKLLRQHAGGTFTHAILDGDNPEISD
jgi:DNA/RNA-binding domain of Phe-tRNA-synthetase-like protein